MDSLHTQGHQRINWDASSLAALLVAVALACLSSTALVVPFAASLYQQRYNACLYILRR